MPRVAAEGGDELCGLATCLSCVSASSHEELQSICPEPPAILRPDLLSQVGQVLVEPAEVIEVLAIAHPLGLRDRPNARVEAWHAGLAGIHAPVPAARHKLVFLARFNQAVALAAFVLLARGGRGFGLEIGHNESSPAVHRQAVELGEGLLLGAALEVSAAHDHRLPVARKRRHGAEGKVAAIAVSVGARCAHATFGLMVHRHGPR